MKTQAEQPCGVGNGDPEYVVAPLRHFAETVAPARARLACHVGAFVCSAVNNARLMVEDNLVVQ